MKEKIEYYTIKPNLKQIYGKKVTKNTVFDEKSEDGTVTQHFENLTLTTTIKKKIKASNNNPFSYEEKSKVSVKVPEGTILIWNEQECFIIPQYQMTTLEELEEEIKDIKEIYNQEDKK